MLVVAATIEQYLALCRTAAARPGWHEGVRREVPVLAPRRPDGSGWEDEAAAPVTVHSTSGDGVIRGALQVLVCRDDAFAPIGEAFATLAGGCLRRCDSVDELIDRCAGATSAVVLSCGALTTERLVRLGLRARTSAVGVITALNLHDAYVWIARRMLAFANRAEQATRPDLTVQAYTAPPALANHRLVDTARLSAEDIAMLQARHWGCVAIESQGESIDCSLGDWTLCGLPPLRRADGTRRHCCEFGAHCPWGDADQRVEVESLRMDVLFLASCYGVGMEGLYPSTLSMALACLRTGAAGFVSSVKNSYHFADLPLLFRALFRAGLPLAEAVRTVASVQAELLNEPSSAHVPSYLTIGDPAFQVDSRAPIAEETMDFAWSGTAARLTSHCDRPAHVRRLILPALRVTGRRYFVETAHADGTSPPPRFVSYDDGEAQVVLVFSTDVIGPGEIGLSIWPLVLEGMVPAVVEAGMAHMRYVADKAKRGEEIASTVNRSALAADMERAVADAEPVLLMLREVRGVGPDARSLVPVHRSRPVWRSAQKKLRAIDTALAEAAVHWNLPHYTPMFYGGYFRAIPDDMADTVCHVCGTTTFTATIQGRNASPGSGAPFDDLPRMPARGRCAAWLGTAADHRPARCGRRPARQLRHRLGRIGGQAAHDVERDARRVKAGGLVLGIGAVAGTGRPRARTGSGGGFHC